MDKLMFLMGTEAVLNTDVVSISELVVVDVVVDVVVEVVVVVEQRSVMSSKSTSVTS